MPPGVLSPYSLRCCFPCPTWWETSPLAFAHRQNLSIRRSLIGSEGGILHPSRYEASPEYVVKFIATYEKEGGLPP